MTPIKKGATPKAKPIRIVTESSSGDAIYANFIEIGHTEHEFLLIAARLPTKPSAAILAQAAERGELVLEPEVQIMFPARIIGSLISALQVQRDEYERRFGKIVRQVDGKDA